MQTDASTWATNSGYKITRFKKLTRTEPCTMSDLAHSHLPLGIQLAHKLEYQSCTDYNSIIHASDIEIFIWNWNPSDSRERNHKFFIISRENEILCSEPNSHPIWLDSFPCFRRESETLVSMAMNPICQPLDNTLNKITICLGGMHFGHWVSDTLPKIIASKNQLPSNRILTTKLSQEEREFICRRLELSDTEFAEIDPHGFHFHKLLIKQAEIFGDLTVTEKNQILRNAVALTCTKIAVYDEKPVYLKRGQISGNERITNEQSLIEELIARGVSILDPREFPFYTHPEKYLGFSKFIFYNSSINTNFNVLARESSKALVFLHPSFNKPTIECIVGAAVYLLPRLTQIIPKVLQGNPNEHFNSPLDVNLEEISYALTDFLKGC